MISIHALLAESDYRRLAKRVKEQEISIHALLAESDEKSYDNPLKSGYFYPRSPCGERHAPLQTTSQQSGISIHALLAESDPGACLSGPPGAYFYPRSPCGERPFAEHAKAGGKLFLSTLSLRRATLQDCQGFYLQLFLSTLSLRRATGLIADNPCKRAISIHALLAESDRTP